MAVTAVSSPNSHVNPSDSLREQANLAGTQFEAVLLNMVFGDLQHSFSQLPGAKEDGVMKTYDGFGMEALSSELAHGGIGLGAVIAKALLAESMRAAQGV